MGRTSIYTIGKELGVSPATVSRALNMNPAISAEIRERVLRAAERHNFKPRFVSNRPTAIYALIQQVKGHPLDFDNFVARFLEGIAEYCRDEGLEVGLFASNIDRLNECDVVRELRKRGANAAVILRGSTQSEYINQMDSQGFPYFCLFSAMEPKPANFFTIDNAILAEEAIRHLLDLGHRRIGFVLDSINFSAHMDRLEGYKNALVKAGLEYDPSLVFTGDSIIERSTSGGGGLKIGSVGVKSLLEASPDMTAVFAVSDMVAKGVLGGLYECGVAVPKRVSVMGFEDYPENAYSCPSLSAVHVPYTRIAYEAARQAHRLFKGLSVKMPEGLGGDLVLRESTGPAPDLKRRET